MILLAFLLTVLADMRRLAFWAPHRVDTLIHTPTMQRPPSFKASIVIGMLKPILEEERSKLLQQPSLYG